MKTPRFAFVRGARRREEVAAYLPNAYAVLGEGMTDGRTFYVIGGWDDAGWTLDGYVIPRLASGLMAAEEVDEARAREVVASSSRPDSYIGLPKDPDWETRDELITKALGIKPGETLRIELDELA